MQDKPEVKAPKDAKADGAKPAGDAAKKDKDDPYLEILGVLMFATRSTIHSTRTVIQAQLVFEYDAMINDQHEANLPYIKKKRLNYS